MMSKTDLNLNTRGARPPRWVFPLLAGVTAFILYLLTMGTSWGFVDGGELSMVASKPGIAHPTGYPTVTMLGYLVIQLIPGRDVVVLNGFSAFLAAAGVTLLAFLFLRLLNLMRGGDDHHRPHMSASASAAALLVGTGTIWWFQGTLFEVYALHIVMSLAAVLLFFRYVREQGEKERTTGGEDVGGEKPAVGAERGRSWTGPAFGLAVGLGFTTHMTMVLWGPALLFYYFRTLGFNVRSLLNILKLAPWFLVGLLPYLYLPLRSPSVPEAMVGNLDMPSELFRHVSGSDFSIMQFHSIDIFLQQVQWFFNTLPGEVAWAGIFLALWGLWVSWLRNRAVGIWSVLVFAVVVIWMSNYAILDVEAQFIPALMMVGFWCAAGLFDLGQRFGGAAAPAIGCGLVAVNVALNYAPSDQSENRYAEELTLNMLEGLAPNSIIFSDDWDFWVSGSLYAQRVDGVRPDVEVVYATMLHHKWYRDLVAQLHPRMMRGLDSLSREYQRKVDAFWAGDRTQGNPYEDMIRLMHAMIDNEIDHRPVYLGAKVDFAFAAPYELVPNGLALRVIREPGYVPQEFPTYRRTSSVDRVDHYVAMLSEMYARSLMARGQYEAQYGNVELGRRYLDSALTYDPGYDPADAPDLPLNGEEQIGLTATFFDELRRMKAAGFE